MRVSEKEIEVRYAETDAMQVVYHGQYLVWFELGRTQLMEDLGFRYADMEEEGYLAPVLDVQVSYRKPFRYGEKAWVYTWIQEYNGVRTVYGYEIKNRDGDVCVTGTTSHTLVKKESFRPVSMKRTFPDWHEIYLKNTQPAQ
ncbi:acyl-CoA thioesterase [Bacillus thermotolerans]|uniref:acyl-CoA thioesterase n=1 Tax=Bacillus thermotolerans TaxID=1221996 RepID=UPI000589220A|nr:thioesterase family protein [Bacillus thermotolerans]KKB44551.1 4-hydroxybenzoyl-CoA thioesterase family active site [Bacillus thermotolerans]